MTILRKVFAIVIIAFLLQTYIDITKEVSFLKLNHGMYPAEEITYYSEEYGELKFKSYSETGYYIWQNYEREFYTRTGGTVTIKYASILGFYIDLTDEEKNRETANLR